MGHKLLWAPFWCNSAPKAKLEGSHSTSKVLFQSTRVRAGVEHNVTGGAGFGFNTLIARPRI